MKSKYTGFDSYLIPAGIFVGMILFILLFFTPKIELGAGVKVPEAPLQSPPLDKTSFKSGDYHITPLAGFKCKAKIISSKTYNDVWSDICPIDFTLGWQQLSDESIIRQIHFSQRRRWTYFRYNRLPEGMQSKQDIISQHSNMHMCPADDEIRSAMLHAPIGGIIEFEGKLIQLSKPGFNAKSSTSRNDTQGGACEIVWVEKFNVIDN